MRGLISITRRKALYNREEVDNISKQIEQINKICPLRNDDCALNGCAWWVESECAIRSLGFLDHTMQAIAVRMGVAQAPSLAEDKEE